MKKRVIIYTRVSTSVQDTDRQEQELKEYCKKNKFEVIDIVKEKVSGATSWKDRKLYEIVSNEVIMIIQISKKGNSKCKLYCQQPTFSKFEHISLNLEAEHLSANGLVFIERGLYSSSQI